MVKGSITGLISPAHQGFLSALKTHFILLLWKYKRSSV
jgi:hypothetical protein